jgi:putative redox protein
MTPPELLLATLGTCAGYYAAQYPETKGLSAGKLTVRVSAEKALQPARLASFVVAVEAPDVVPTHHDRLLRAVKACLFPTTLTQTPSIELHIHAAAPTAA